MPKIIEETHVYPDIEVHVCIGDNALTADIAKDLLGWKSETKGIKFGDSYILIDENKCKVRCFNNTKNRPLNEEWCRSLAQDILNRRWQINLETIIIGQDAQVLSGQHRLIGLVLASQLWANDKTGHWKEKWDTEPVIETLVAFGADESEECTRTLDNVRPRTLSDVLYVGGSFGMHKPKDRKVLVRIVDYAVRLLWQRTGVSRNEFVSKRTHSEALDFISNHPRILDAVRHVYDEDQGGNIRKFIGLGYAAGLLYLMAASNDSRDAYVGGGDDQPSEVRIDMGRWEDACQFWTLFGQATGLRAVKVAIQPQPESEDEEQRLMTIHEQLAIIVKAWLAFIDGQPVTAKTVALRYQTKDGFRMLTESPTVGGIDVGMYEVKAGAEGEEEETPEE